MALLPQTPKEESRNYPGLESWDFGNSYLPTARSDWSEVSTKVVGLLKSFPTPCRTFSSDVGKRSISDFGNLTFSPSFAHNLGYGCPNDVQGHFENFHFKTFPMTPRTLTCEEI
jgi:hypothetical protein